MRGPDIETENLGVHVALCSIRFTNLQEKMDNLENRMSRVEEMLSEVKDLVVSMSEQRNTRLIQWGAGIITALATALAYLVFEIIIKAK